MRFTSLLIVPFTAALSLLPVASPAQINVAVKFGTRLGPELDVFAYSQSHQGDWRSNYNKWTPVTVYDVNGHYYRARVAGSRPVSVYMYDEQYFLPPTDAQWANTDRRYNYRQRPNDNDMRRGGLWRERERVDPRMGSEIGVLAYSADRAGDWRRNSRRWTPVMVYEFKGHYYARSGNGARGVMVYRYHDEYFLPPNDDQWNNSDKRFDMKHVPDNGDRGRVRGRP